MVWAAAEAAADDPAILHAAIALAPEIAAASALIEQGRRIPPALAQAMKDAGIFGMAMPRAWGGPELDLLTQLRVIEALAMADGSVGWCAMVGCDSGYMSAFLDQDVARAMYPDIWVATAGAATPTGKATRVAGGYRVEGRFPFVSGCQHAQWMWGGCIVHEDGAPHLDANGVPETRHCFLDVASQCEILDTWHTTGLRGTGSNDVLVRETFVPEERSFSFRDPALIKREGPLHQFPRLFIAKGPAAALGIARHALDALIESLATRPARLYIVGDHLDAPEMLRDEVFVQEAVGHADTLLASVRAYYFESMAEIWEAVVAGNPLNHTQLARFTTAHAHVIGTCVTVVELVYKTVGGPAAYEKHPFDRCLRDLLTMNQHVVATLRTYEMAGRLILGLAPLRWII